ncbi:hypothetical protein AV540_07015 [Brevibacillus parabrevis]|uniref:RDD family protein n=1 Tax=Brevibacillus parabrevis TaxID=54914 RepID=UPI0007ABC11D|nr:RDD family protein [Brevibacillus parabrevis]KZE53974.1 hypothetical protein AV540_07015 [Brevibacillus parabrevis]
MSDPDAIQALENSQETSREHQFAGFWIRVAATLLDSLFLIGVSMLIFNSLRRNLGVSGDFLSLIDLLEALFGLLYLVLLTWWTGQTLGKQIIGIRVISAKHARGRLTGGQVILREVLGKLLSSLVFCIGYMWVGWNPQKQGWHDLLAKTYVIWDRK